MPALFDLDALDREDALPPFTVSHGGAMYVLASPRRMLWRNILALGTGSPEQDLAVLLGEHVGEFSHHPLPRWKLDMLLAAWRRHYGLGEAVASSTC